MDLMNKSYHFSCGKSSILQKIKPAKAGERFNMREKIMVALFTVSFVFSYLADRLSTGETEDKEYRISLFGHNCDFC